MGRFAYSTNAFKRFSLQETLRLVKSIGYDGVEIMADVPHLYPPHYADKTKLNELRSLLEELQLPVSNLNTFTLFAVGDMHHPSWIEKEEELRRTRIEHTKSCLRLAKELNCPNISIQPGGKLEHFTEQEASELFIRQLEKEILPLAEELNVAVLVEPEPELLLENSEQFENFIKNFDTPFIGLNCDVGHFVCAGEDPAEVIRRLKKYIKHIHIEDIKERIHEHKIPSEGDIDFESVFDALYEIGYDGFVSVELYPYQDNPVEAGRKALQHLKAFIR